MPASGEAKLVRVVERYRRRETAYREARDELLAAMVEAREAGLTLARIAALVGMSRQRVMELLARHR